MKPLIFTFVTACISLFSTAQKPGVFFRLGINFSTVSTVGNSVVDNAKVLPTWQVGIMGDIPFSKFFAIQTGAIYTGKGAKLERFNSSGFPNLSSTSKPMYIEVPLNAVVKAPGKGKNPDFFIGLGPYAAIGVAGKREIGDDDNNKKRIVYSDADISTFESEDAYSLGVIRRFDFGFNGTAGFIGKGGFMVAFNYGYGMKKLQSGEDSDYGRNENRVISVIMGVKL